MTDKQKTASNQPGLSTDWLGTAYETIESVSNHAFWRDMLSVVGIGSMVLFLGYKHGQLNNKVEAMQAELRDLQFRHCLDGYVSFSTAGAVLRMGGNEETAQRSFEIARNYLDMAGQVDSGGVNLRLADHLVE